MSRKELLGLADDVIFPMDSTAKPLCRIFGVRHLSPAAAHHLHTVLDDLRPTAVLVEGPADATEQIKHLVHKDTRPPLALLAYTRERPVRSILYPLASYSPEWAALTWGVRNKADVRFIDLPASVFLQLHHADKDEPATSDDPVPKKGQQASEHTVAYLDDPWSAIAELSGDPDHETWWERHFEHTTEPAAYVRQILEFGRGLRELKQLDEKDENLVREAYMRRCIREVLAKGHKPDKVLVVCGAFHAPALIESLPAMTDKAVKELPRVEASLTLMPYSYFRLSSQSGYGAGNHAPAYFQRLFDARRAGAGDGLIANFLSELCHALRRAGQVRSAAEVIEAVRLATSLAALSDSPAPCLRDLRDAAVCCLGRAEPDVVAPHLHELEVGSAVGRLPKGISRTSIQDDFYLLVEELNLQKLQTEKEQEVTLDLRENRFVKTKDAAFRDLNRSTFLHRLLVLEVRFGQKKKTEQDQATWKEIWKLRWTPENEIQLVEGSLLGDTVEVATAVRLSQRLQECTHVDEAANLVKDAVECQLADALDNARRRLQAMAVEESGFVQLAHAADSLAEVVRYGSVRKIDPEPLKPLLAQLFLRATLSVKDACLCDDTTAREQIRPAIVKLNDVARENPELVDAARWDKELDGVASSDALNAFLSGFVLSLLLARVDEERLSREVGRRLSPGIAPDIGAAWFEGLVQYNREALFSRLALWRQLDEYLRALDDDGFRRALVPLRRAFSEFTPGQVRRVVSCLVEVSTDSADQLKQSVDVKLSDEEARKLQETLGDLDLGI
ncbi:MAG TPA: DUF5682 family protein [Gemmataceae bacterium]|nr:DUF5682 family protein [Gemmataceae bacterium]